MPSLGSQHDNGIILIYGVMLTLNMSTGESWVALFALTALDTEVIFATC